MLVYGYLFGSGTYEEKLACFVLFIYSLALDRVNGFSILRTKMDNYPLLLSIILVSLDIFSARNSSLSIPRDMVFILRGRSIPSIK